ncbi:glucose-6-phosphate dehydrogenase [Patescibacteria group bacterium]|nr:glucose-6-phosphate dehydrogenase [Patescibacteria group bacterium]
MDSPFALIIFGATGDLACNKLFPSLFSLFKQGLLPEEFSIIGFSRREYRDEDFRIFFKDLVNEEKWGDFAKHIFYQQGDFSDKKGYLELIDKLKKLDEKLGACITRFFYLATPPTNYEPILEHLKSTKLAEGCGQKSSQWTRIIIEKPFGKDLETAVALDEKLSKIFEERQIFRVDHYLGKETIQNMIAFRFANGIFEPVWNKNFIDHVQITFAEEKGIGKRGRFFDGVGMLRDVGQNHIMQMIAAVAMEQPKSFTKDDMRDVRANAIKAIRCAEPNQVDQYVVRGQYEGFQEEPDIDPDSDTETFVAMKLFVDTERFKNVPFYVRAGKKMPKSTVEISVVFIQTCHILFKEYGCPEIGNVLKIRIQPDEGITLRVIAKIPGSKVSLGTVNMNFNYEDEFHTKGKDAYEKVLLDIFVGDQMLFNRSDELSASWSFITKILKGWEKTKAEVLPYQSGTWGPEEANELIKKDGRKWL